MKKTNILLTGIFVAATIAIVGYAYVVFSNRYGRKTENNSNKNQNSVIDNLSDYLDGGNQNGNLTGSSQSENLNENQNQNENTNTNTNANTGSASLKDVTSKDCNDDCSRFKDNAANYRYCQQVCGDIPISEKNSVEECADLTSDEKDYCLKDLAITKKDFSICNQIVDAKVKKTCKNRITEDLLN